MSVKISHHYVLYVYGPARITDELGGAKLISPDSAWPIRVSSVDDAEHPLTYFCNVRQVNGNVVHYPYWGLPKWMEPL